jgi:glycosyltransferase involved in cell wall biosynthesis
VPLYPSHDRSALGRAANYLSFAASASVAATFWVEKPDVAYVYHPPATVGIPAAFLSLLRRVPVVLDIQDLWPDTLRASGMLNNTLALGLIGALCSGLYSVVTRIAVLSPGFKRRLIERGVSSGRVSVVYNWCDELSLNAAAALMPGEAELLAGKFNVVFAGNIGPAQALDVVIDASAVLRESHPLVQFVIVGSGIDLERLRQRAAAQHAVNVLFLPRRPVHAINAVLSRADALLVHLRDDELFSITIPSKTQAYLLAGKPIIMAVRGDAADLVRDSNAGLVCEPCNVHALVAVIRRLADMPVDELARFGAAGRAYYRSRLSLECGVSRFEDEMRAAAGGVGIAC